MRYGLTVQQRSSWATEPNTRSQPQPPLTSAKNTPLHLRTFIDIIWQNSRALQRLLHRRTNFPVIYEIGGGISQRRKSASCLPKDLRFQVDGRLPAIKAPNRCRYSLRRAESSSNCQSFAYSLTLCFAQNLRFCFVNPHLLIQLIRLQSTTLQNAS